MDGQQWAHNALITSNETLGMVCERDRWATLGSDKLPFVAAVRNKIHGLKVGYFATQEEAKDWVVSEIKIK